AAAPPRRARAGRRHPKIPAWHSRRRRFFDSVPRFRCAPSPRLQPNSGSPEFGRYMRGRSRIYPTSAERVGVRGAFQVLNLWRSPLTRRAPQARLPACPSTPPRARGEVEPTATQALRHTQEERSYDSRRALEARERFVDLEAARLGFLAPLALAFDHILRRARDEVGIGELGVDAGDIGFNA